MTGSYSANRFVGWVALAILNCAVIIPWLSGLVPQPRDFNCFYTGAQVYRHNPGHLLYDLPLQLRTEQQMFGFDEGLGSKYFLPFNHSPYELALWLPLTMLPFHLAFWVWRIVSVGLLALTSWLLAKVPDLKRPAPIIFVMLLAFFPVPSSLMSGQDTALTLFLFAVSLWFLRTGKYVYAGMVLGLCLYKPQLVVPVIGVLVLCRFWRVLAGFASSGAAVLAISSAMVGFDGMRSLLRLWLGESGILFCIRPPYMPNIRGLLTNISGLSPHWVTIAAAIVSLLLLILAAKQAKLAQSPARMFALCMCLVPLVSFHTNVYDLSILILPILLLLNTLPRLSIRQRWIATPPIFLLFCTPVYVVAAAVGKIGLLAVFMGWLWYALVVATKSQQTDAAMVMSSVPELATAHN